MKNVSILKFPPRKKVLVDSGTAELLLSWLQSLNHRAQSNLKSAFIISGY